MVVLAAHLLQGLIDALDHRGDARPPGLDRRGGPGSPSTDSARSLARNAVLQMRWK
jgi:hypothetical protein